MPHSSTFAAMSNRETLLCIHGSAATGRSWSTIAAVLGARFDVAMPDRLGCGRDGGWRAGAPASFEAEARHLASWLCERPQGAHVLAHSYGAAIAIELALRWPHRVRSLTLYEPARFALLFDESEPVAERDEILRTGGLVSLWVKSGRPGDAARMFVNYWSGPGAWDALDERRQRGVCAGMPKVAAEFEAAFADRAPLHAFERLTMPVRLMAGEDSPAPTRRIARTLARLMPAADLVELAGVGHMGPLTHPHAVIDNLPAWLATAERRVAA